MEVSRHHGTCLIIRTCCITPNELARAGAVHREMHCQGSCRSARRLATRCYAHIYESMFLFYCHAHSVRFCRVFSGCWVLGIGCIEYTYRTQTNSYERCSRAFHSVIPLKQCHVLRAYAHWLYQQRQPAPCRPVVSAHRSKPPGSPWLLIPSCPAGATGPGLECRASIKHGPGMRVHMPRRGSPIARRN